VYFGEKVRQLRTERSLTQPQLAQAIGIEQSYLSKLENDKSVPSADIFQAILKAFSVDVATLLAGVDEKQIRSDLRQVPEVSEHLKAQVVTRIHGIKRWLYASGVALALGLALGLAGYRGLLVSNEQYNYESPGVLQVGESPDFFEEYAGLLHQQRNAGLITDQERVARVLEIESRKSPEYRLLDEYRGRGFMEQVPGGSRFYYFQHSSVFERPQNRWLMFIGALLACGGIAGFIIEARLRSVRP
jgi:transcriptional regulator with XRE-family HTH domain